MANGGTYDVCAHLGAMASQADSNFSVSVGGQTITFKTQLTGHYDKPQWFHVGTLLLREGRPRFLWRLIDFPRGHSADIHGFRLLPTPGRLRLPAPARKCKK